MGQAQSTQHRPPRDIPLNGNNNKKQKTNGGGGGGGGLEAPPDWKPAGGGFQQVSPVSDLSNPSQFRHRLPDPSRRALERHRTSKVCSTAVPTQSRHRRRSNSMPPPSRFSFSQPAAGPVEQEPQRRPTVADLGLYIQESRDESDKPVMQIDSRDENERGDKPLRQWRVFRAKAHAARNVMTECWKDRSHQVKQVVDAAVEPCTRPSADDSRLTDAMLLADSKKVLHQHEPLVPPMPYVQLEPSNRDSMPPSKFEPIWREAGTDASLRQDRLVYMHSQEAWVHRLSGEKDSISPLKHSPVPADPTIRHQAHEGVLSAKAPEAEAMSSPVANLFEDKDSDSVGSSPYDERRALAAEQRVASPPVLSVKSNTSTPLEIKPAHPVVGSQDTLPAAKRLSMGTVSTQNHERSSSSDSVSTRPTMRDLDKTDYTKSDEVEPDDLKNMQATHAPSLHDDKEARLLASLDNLPVKEPVASKPRASIESQSQLSQETTSTRRASKSRASLEPMSRASETSPSELSVATVSTRRPSPAPAKSQVAPRASVESQLSSETVSTRRASVESRTSRRAPVAKSDVPINDISNIDKEDRPMARVASVARISTGTTADVKLDSKRLSIQEDMQRQIDAQLEAESQEENAASPATRVQRLRQQYQKQLQRLSTAASKRRAASAPRTRPSLASTSEVSQGGNKKRRQRSVSVPRHRESQESKSSAPLLQEPVEEPKLVAVDKKPVKLEEVETKDSPTKEVEATRETSVVDAQAVAMELKNVRNRLDNYEQRKQKVTSAATILQQTFPLAQVFSSEESEIRAALMSPEAETKSGALSMFSPTESTMSHSSAPMVSNQALSNATFLFSPSYAGGDMNLLRAEREPVRPSEEGGTVSITTLDSRSRLSMRSNPITIPISRIEHIEGVPNDDDDEDDTSSKRIVRFSDVHEVISASRLSLAESTYSSVAGQPKTVEIPAIESTLSDLSDTTAFRSVRQTSVELGKAGETFSVISEESAVEPNFEKKASRPTTAKWSYAMDGEMATGVTPLRSGKSTNNGTNSPYLRFKEAKHRFSGVVAPKEAPVKKVSPVKRAKGGLVHSRVVAMEDKLSVPRRSSIGRRSSISIKVASPVKRGSLSKHSSPVKHASPVRRASMESTRYINPRASVEVPEFCRQSMDRKVAMFNHKSAEPLYPVKSVAPKVAPVTAPVWAKRQSVESLITTEASIDPTPGQRYSLGSSPRGLEHVSTYDSSSQQRASIGSSPRGLAHVPTYDSLSFSQQRSSASPRGLENTSTFDSSSLSQQRSSVEVSPRGLAQVATYETAKTPISDDETSVSDDPFGEIMMATTVEEPSSDPEESPVNLYEMHRAAMESPPSETDDDFEKLLQYQDTDEEDSCGDETVSTIKQDRAPSYTTSFSSYRLSAGHLKGRPSVSSSVGVSISHGIRTGRESMSSIGESTVGSTVIASRPATLPFRSNSGPVKPTEQMHRVVPGAPSQYNPTQPSKWRALAAAAQKQDGNRTFGTNRLAVRNPNIVGH